MKKTIIATLFLSAFAPQLASALCKVDTCYDKFGKPNCCPFDGEVHSQFTNASQVSGEKVKDEILNAIPVTKPIANGQHFKGMSPNGNQCQITVSWTDHPYQGMTVSGIEYVSPTDRYDYHYFQAASWESASVLSDSSQIAFSIVRNQKMQSIEISSLNNQRLVSISDFKGATQCLINLN